MVTVAPKRGLMADSEMGGSRRGGRKVAFGETRGAHAGRERQPGKGIEFVIDVEGFEIGGRALADGEGRISAAVIEDGAEGLVVALVEAEESNLQIVLLVVGGEGGLASDVGGGAVFRGGDGNVVGIAGVVAAVVVVEGRNRGQEMRIESVQPGEEDAGIGLGLAIAKTDAGIVRVSRWPGLIRSRCRWDWDRKESGNSRGGARSSGEAGWRDRHCR